MKKFLLSIIAFCLFLGLSACSGGSSNNGELAAYKAENEALKQQIQQLEEQLSVYTNGEIPVGDNTNKPQSPAEPTTITLGQTVRIEDVLEFTITSCAWETQILPSNTNGSYSYKADVEDETYLVFRGQLTNLNGQSISVDHIQESEILINGKYTFYVRMDAEDTDGAGYSTSTKPLQTVNFVIYASVSDGVKEIFEEATVTLHLLNDPDRTQYFFDKEDDCKNTYTIHLSAQSLS